MVVALGGDGTVNEVVNGLLRDGPGEKVPALGGGAGRLDQRVRPGARPAPGRGRGDRRRCWTRCTQGRSRPVGLGRADGRYFTFCAGFGLDAEVVRKVERARLRGKVSTPGLYIRSTVHPVLPGDRPADAAADPRAARASATEPDLANVIIQNTAPWTYLGDRPVNPCPDASFETGLDLMAMRALHVPATTRAMAQILSRRPESSRSADAATARPGGVHPAGRPAAGVPGGRRLSWVRRRR